MRSRVVIGVVLASFVVSAAVAAVAWSPFSSGAHRSSVLANEQPQQRRAAYPVTLERGVTPRMTSRQVASIVLLQLGAGASIDRINLLASETQLASFEPNAGSASLREAQRLGPVWIVRAHGSFISTRTPPGQPNPIRGSTGYYEIADRDGAIIGMGMP